MTEQANRDDLLALTTEIVSSYVANNTILTSEVSGFIDQVFKALANASAEGNFLADRPQPAVPIKRSVTPDYIVCLEDGKKLKMLKRHLMTAYKMTPEEYKERWGLPADYPMVAPSYAERRSKLAKEIGLGTRGRGNTST
ncbi:MAG: MucR family transcriptional regulator [Alphaproteobacteria bacterium]|nr:MucR family transcriptional regulator [Alphaproteobacteria bacterium]